MITRLTILAVLLTLGTQNAIAETNPPAEGFNQSESDAKAIEIADAVMEKMGGWENWNQTRYITWRFFGRRMHVWDKWTGNLRHKDGGHAHLDEHKHEKRPRVVRRHRANKTPTQ